MLEVVDRFEIAGQSGADECHAEQACEGCLVAGRDGAPYRLRPMDLSVRVITISILLIHPAGGHSGDFCHRCLEDCIERKQFVPSPIWR